MQSDKELAGQGEGVTGKEEEKEGSGIEYQDYELPVPA